MTVPPLAFTLADAERAHDEWGCNCGPAALAAVLGKTLDDVRPHIPLFEERRYTNPSMMFAALVNLQVRFKQLPRNAAGVMPWPAFGLARIQWDGPWTQPGVPMRARYRHSHWVGACARVPANVGIFDINALNSGGWVRLDDWERVIVPYILENSHPRANGRWHITHSLEILA